MKNGLTQEDKDTLYRTMMVAQLAPDDVRVPINVGLLRKIAVILISGDKVEHTNGVLPEVKVPDEWLRG